MSCWQMLWGHIIFAKITNQSRMGVCWSREEHVFKRYPVLLVISISWTDEMMCAVFVGKHRHTRGSVRIHHSEEFLIECKALSVVDRMVDTFRDHGNHLLYKTHRFIEVCQITSDGFIHNHCSCSVEKATHWVLQEAIQHKHINVDTSTVFPVQFVTAQSR